MTTRRYKIGAVLTLLCLLAGTAQAQTHKMHLGPRLSYQFDAEEIGLGAQFSVPIASQLEFYPSFDIFFTSPNSLWSFNADLKWRVAPTSVNWLYLGTGLNLMGGGGGDGSNAGLNLFGGIESLKGRIHPFAEMRFIVNDNSTAQLAAGINFTL
ncbi:MAG TPA: hypothetical protein PLI70_01380 [Gemmatimonadales bacterium]|nr:hypothetical protein [Gemmatimonadales bacterium]HRZ09358.1 hypothetical protein [Gemmatimonadales bacterium]